MFQAEMDLQGITVRLSCTEERYIGRLATVLKSLIDDQPDPVLGRHIARLELSARASNILERAKVETIGDLIRMTPGDILKLRSAGKTTLREIDRALATIGYGLTDAGS